jgi:hypothetical protein
MVLSSRITQFVRKHFTMLQKNCILEMGKSFLAPLFDDCNNLKNTFMYDAQRLENASKITIHPEEYLLEL